MHDPPYKHCLTCGERFAPSPKAKPAEWAKRRFCGPGCGRVSPCRGCGERKPKAPAATNQHGRKMAGLCEACYRAGLKVPNYGTGRSASLRSGYIRIRAPRHPLAGADGYVYEHRKVWYDANGEIPCGHHIHHVNEDKADNRLENLEMLSDSAHSLHHLRERGYVENQWGVWPLRGCL